MINYFANLKVLFLLLFIPIFIFWELKKPKPTLNYSDTSSFSPKNSQKLYWIDLILLALKCLALILFIVALARPQHTLKQKEIYRNGVDVILALDASGSMAAEDLQPNRLSSAKKIMQNFIIKRENDRLGLVVFGERAITKAPLTFDREMLVNLVEKVRLGEAGDRTAIGQALVNSLNRIRDSKAKSRIVILVTDGENNAGNIGPLEAAKLAVGLGIKIYTIGIGSEEGAPYPIFDPQYGKQYARYPDGTLALTKLNAKDLINIADLTNARYYQAKTSGQLQLIFKEIDKLEKVKLKNNISFQYQERFVIFIVLGLVVMLLELGLGKTILRIIP